MIAPAQAVGYPDLVFWQYGPGVCRFQTCSPEIARKLSQRSGARLVAWSVSGGYLRIFQEKIEPWRARCLVGRYLTPTNGAITLPARPLSRRESKRVSTQPDDGNEPAAEALLGRKKSPTGQAVGENRPQDTAKSHPQDK
jgi:hypothetical protein